MGSFTKDGTGVQLLRETLGDKALDFQQLGGHELFLKKDSALFQACTEKRDDIMGFCAPFGGDAFQEHPNTFRFENILDKYVTNRFEDQLDTGKMMAQLLRLVQIQGVTLLNNISVEDFSDNATNIAVKTDRFEFKTKKLLLATNGFASQLLNENV